MFPFQYLPSSLASFIVGSFLQLVPRTRWYSLFVSNALLLNVFHGMRAVLVVINLMNFLQVKLWDLTNNQPSCIASRNPKAVCDLQIFFDS